MTCVSRIFALCLLVVLVACDQSLSRWDRVRIDLGEADVGTLTVEAGPDLVTNQTFSRRAETTATDPLTFSWEKVSGPGEITFSASNQQETTITTDADGVYVIRVTITNEWGEMGQDQFQLTWDASAPSSTNNLKTLAGSLTGSDVRLTNQTTIVFSWDGAVDTGVGLRDYTITWFDGADCSGLETTVTSLNATNHTITGSHGHTYSYKVTAYDTLDQAVTSACSPNITVDTVAPAQLDGMSGVTLTTVATTQLTLNLPSDTADYHQILIRRIVGATAPANCSSGAVAKTFNANELSDPLVFTDITPVAGGVVSYLACIRDAAGNETGSNAATNIATKQHYIFGTSQTVDGKINGAGGVAAADNLCNTLAGLSSIAGVNSESNWKAVLSTSTVDAKDRAIVLGTVFSPSDSLIANDSNDLWDGSLQTFISEDEEGIPMFPGDMWTGTLSDGTKSSNTCNDWTDNTAGAVGQTGDIGQMNGEWIEIPAGGASVACNLSAHVYCLSQP